MNKNFYVGLAAYLLALVVVGFWPSYFKGLVTGAEYTRHWVFHLHSMIFMAWMILFLVQALLIRRRKTKTHKSVGSFGFILGIAVWVMGILITSVVMNNGFADGAFTSLPQAIWGLSSPILDMVQFAILIWLGWAHRLKSEHHKRYMLLATIAIMPAATFRMSWLLGSWSFEINFIIFMAILILHDRRILQKIHPANLMGIGILLPRLILSVAQKIFQD